MVTGDGAEPPTEVMICKPSGRPPACQEQQRRCMALDALGPSQRNEPVHPECPDGPGRLPSWPSLSFNPWVVPAACPFGQPPMRHHGQLRMHRSGAELQLHRSPSPSETV